jgi:hypothetical protein
VDVDRQEAHRPNTIPATAISRIPNVSSQSVIVSLPVHQRPIYRHCRTPIKVQHKSNQTAEYTFSSPHLSLSYHKHPTAASACSQWSEGQTGFPQKPYATDLSKMFLSDTGGIKYKTPKIFFPVGRTI